MDFLGILFLFFSFFTEGLHDGENFDLYHSWLQNYERPVQHQVNCGYFSTKSSLSAQSSTNATPRRPKLVFFWLL